MTQTMKMRKKYHFHWFNYTTSSNIIYFIRDWQCLQNKPANSIFQQDELYFYILLASGIILSTSIYRFFQNLLKWTFARNQFMIISIGLMTVQFTTSIVLLTVFNLGVKVYSSDSYPLTPCLLLLGHSFADSILSFQPILRTSYLF